MSEPCTAQPLPVLIQAFGRTYVWTPGEGLDPAVVESVDGYIRREAQRFQQAAAGRGVSFDDLYQQGMLGALEAAKRFDPAFANTFLTYAAWWIRRWILQAIEKATPVYIPDKKRQEAWNKAKEAAALGEPLDAATAAALGYGLSLDAPLPGSEDLSLGDLLMGEDEEENQVQSADLVRRASALWEAMSQLEDRDRVLLCRRWGLGGIPTETLDRIGASMNPPMSRERVRQLEVRALHRLGRYLGRTCMGNPTHLPPMPPRMGR